MELGKDVANHFKAKNFLGFLSIRNGVFVISFSQLLFGVALYCTLHYLHPSLTGVAWFMLALHVFVALLGFFGALKRSMGLHITYMVFYAVSMVFVVMVALDMSELVHFLPKAPQMNDFSLFAVNTPFITKFKMPNNSILFPFSFYKESFLSDNDFPHKSVPNLGKEHLLSKYSVTEIDLHSHKNCKNPVMNYKEISAVKDSPVNADDPNGTMTMDDLNNLKKALREKLDTVTSSSNSTSTTDSNSNSGFNPFNYSNGNSDNTTGSTGTDSNNSSNTNVDNTNTTNTVNNSNQQDNSNNNKESGSIYDSIPFLPHPGETEGESEDVSKEEFPPETKDLTPEGKSEVVVMYKMQKRSVKFAASAFLLVSLLFYLYSYWVALTFALNKCTCLDELSAQPDQFSPLID